MQVFSTAMQFCKNFREITPEAVMYGYAKLLLMDESQIRNLISDDNMEDLDAAHRWFSNNNLNIKLIKSGLMLLIPLIIDNDERKKHVDEFRKFLDRDKKITSIEVLDKAIVESFIDFKDKFAEGRELASIFDYQKELTGKVNQQPKETGSIDGDAPANDESKKKREKEETKKEKEDSDSEYRKETEIKGERQNLTDLSEKYRNLNSALLDVVKGQDHAVLKFIQGYNQGELLKRTERGKHPRAYFFFFGPPGVGKTLLAETAAETLEMPYKLFNMSEYVSYQSHEELVGIPKIYNSAKEGVLVEYVREHPECVLVFDEIEKASITVIRLFLQILGSGKLRNVYRNEDVSFQDTTIIFTSNVGKELYADRSVNLTTLPEKVLIDAIEKEKTPNGAPVLPPEICSRIASGNTILFNHLSVRYLAELVNSNFEKLVADMEEEYGVKITYSKYLPLLFLYSRGGDIDARVATSQSGRFLKNEIYELLRQLQNSAHGKNVTSIDIDIEWDGMAPELVRLFKNEDTTDVLFFASEQYDLSKALTSAKYRIHKASSLEEARNYAKQDIAAVYIDPFFGKGGDYETVLSIADYNTDGVRLFHELVENHASLPIYMLETEQAFSEVDRHTFIQEGAAGTTVIKKERVESFKRQFEQTLEELYMEKESQVFSQRGWVIDFNTKQNASGDKIKIWFYNLKKRKAVDIESRGSILADAERPNIKFDDVIGAEDAKEELRYFVKYLQEPRKFLMNGGRPPKGILLYGPPGTGKTMLAKAMAGESDVTFLQTSASEFKNSYIGESEANIRRIFAKAKKYAPSIIFIDEIDAIGKKRTGSDSNRTIESMLNTLLTEMDGFRGTDSQKPIFVLAATNYGVGAEGDGISSLDDALVRRFDNKIYVDLPKESERKKYILKTLARKDITTVSEETAQNIAERTTGQSLAILQNVIDLAFRNAERQSRTMTDDDLLTALEEYYYGKKKERTPDYYKSVAIHETGHAYVAYIGGDKPSYITIESRGSFGGYMQHANQEDVTSYTRDELLARIRVSLAGRAAEQVFYGKAKSLNTGSSSDLQHATDIAFQIVCTYGMEEGQLITLRKNEIFNSTIAGEYVAKVNEILNTEMKNTIAIIEEAKDKIQKIADVLARENRLTGKQFEELMEM